MKKSACDHNACSVNKKHPSFVKSEGYTRIKPELIFLTLFLQAHTDVYEGEKRSRVLHVLNVSRPLQVL